jgi:hypothetical protein
VVPVSTAVPGPWGEQEADDVPQPPRTGDEAVDEAVRGLAWAMSGSLEEQLAAYEVAHRTLQDRLADVEG